MDTPSTQQPWQSDDAEEPSDAEIVQEFLARLDASARALLKTVNTSRLAALVRCYAAYCDMNTKERETVLGEEGFTAGEVIKVEKTLFRDLHLSSNNMQLDREYTGSPLLWDLSVRGGKPPYKVTLVRTFDQVLMHSQVFDSGNFIFELHELRYLDQGFFHFSVSDASGSHTVSMPFKIGMALPERPSNLMRYLERFLQLPLTPVVVISPDKAALLFREVDLVVIPPAFYSETEGFFICIDLYEGVVFPMETKEIRELEKLVLTKTVLFRALTKETARLLDPSILRMALLAQGLPTDGVEDDRLSELFADGDSAASNHPNSSANLENNIESSRVVGARKMRVVGDGAGAPKPNVPPPFCFPKTKSAEAPPQPPSAASPKASPTPTSTPPGPARQQAPPQPAAAKAAQPAPRSASAAPPQGKGQAPPVGKPPQSSLPQKPAATPIPAKPVDVVVNAPDRSTVVPEATAPGDVKKTVLSSAGNDLVKRGEGSTPPQGLVARPHLAFRIFTSNVMLGFVVAGGVETVNSIYAYCTEKDADGQRVWKDKKMELAKKVSKNACKGAAIAGGVTIGTMVLKEAAARAYGVPYLGAGLGGVFKHSNAVVSCVFFGYSAWVTYCDWAKSPDGHWSGLAARLCVQGAGVSGGFGGSYAGGAIGLAIAGPAGACVGAVLGGLLGSFGAMKVAGFGAGALLQHELNQRVRAYCTFLGLRFEDFTEDAIEARWRTIKRYCHPDKIRASQGRASEMWTLLNDSRTFLLNVLKERQSKARPSAPSMFLLEKQA